MNIKACINGKQKKYINIFNPIPITPPNCVIIFANVSIGLPPFFCQDNTTLSVRLNNASR